MAYFEYDYVNTDYDENSASPPSVGDVEVIYNFVYTIKDVISSKIVNFNYSVVSGTLEKLCDFPYNAFDSFAVKQYEFNYHAIPEPFVNADTDFNYTVELPIFHSKISNLNYHVGVPSNGNVLITRGNEND